MSETPSCPGGVSRSESCLTAPTTDTVGLVRSVLTINRIPLGSFVSETSMKSAGTLSCASATCRPCGQLHRLGRSGCHLFGAAESFAGDWLPGRHWLQGRRDRVLVGQVQFGDAVYIGERDALDGFNVLIGRRAPFGSQRIRPHVGQARDGIPLKLGLGNLAANGRGDQILGHALLRRSSQECRASR